MHLKLFIKFVLECAQFGMWRRLNVLDLEMELGQFGMCSVWNTPFCFQKFVDNSQQCFAFTPQANFPAHNLNFH